MDLRKKLEKDISKQQQKIAELQTQIMAEEGYLRAQMDMLKMFPKEGEKSPEVSLRPGSDPARVRDMLAESGKPMHISEVLQNLGKPVTNEAKAALVGTLGLYVRRREIFTRPAPNTFGLITFNSEQQVEATDPDQPSDSDEDTDLPDDFGK
jgi:hypothetical protein